MSKGTKNRAARAALLAYLDECPEVTVADAARKFEVNASTARVWVKRNGGRHREQRKSTEPIATTGVHPADMSEEDALRSELQWAIAALVACEEDCSWTAAAAHRRIIRDLRKQVAAIHAARSEQWEATPETVAAEINSILSADAKVLTLVVAALCADGHIISGEY